jgi:lysophospholipase L1-like esterase
MTIFCSILMTIATLSSCAKKHPDTTTLTTNMSNKDTIADHMLNYLALGDSYTIGEAVTAGESFPYQLAHELNRQKQIVSTPTIIATTGWTTEELINAIWQSAITDKKFDFVTLLIGVNDQYRGLSQDNYKIKFEQVLNTAIHLVNGDKDHLFVLSIPDYGVTPFGKENAAAIGVQIDRFNAINKQISTAAGVNYLNITAISRQAANDPGLIASDGLHPCGKMYLQWVEQLYPMVVQRLQSNK